MERYPKDKRENYAIYAILLTVRKLGLQQHSGIESNT
jgi:hypothetical protein